MGAKNDGEGNLQVKNHARHTLCPVSNMGLSLSDARNDIDGYYHFP